MQKFLIVAGAAGTCHLLSGCEGGAATTTTTTAATCPFKQIDKRYSHVIWKDENCPALSSGCCKAMQAFATLDLRKVTRRFVGDWDTGHFVEVDPDTKKKMFDLNAEAGKNCENLDDGKAMTACKKAGTVGFQPQQMLAAVAAAQVQKQSGGLAAVCIKELGGTCRHYDDDCGANARCQTQFDVWFHPYGVCECKDNFCASAPASGEKKQCVPSTDAASATASVSPRASSHTAGKTIDAVTLSAKASSWAGVGALAFLGAVAGAAVMRRKAAALEEPLVA